MRKLNIFRAGKLTVAVTALLALAGGFVGVSAAAASQSAAHPVSAVSGETFVIGTDTTFAPFEYRKDGELTGIDMDLIREIAANQGFTVEIKSLGFDAALQALQSNQVDGVIAGMSITDERKLVFDFSDPYFDSGVQMAVAESNTAITGYADLAGETVVAKRGSEGETFAKSIADEYDFTVKSLADSATMYDDVKAGNSVAVFDDYPVLAYGINQNNGLKSVTEKEQGSSYGFAVNKGQNPELLAAFNAGLADLKSSGDYQSILDKYLEQPAPAAASGFFGLLTDSLPALMKGLGLTLLATGLSILIALVLGVLFGFFKVSESRLLRGLASIYVSIFRGTPLLVQAFFFYFGLPQLTGQSIDVLTAGVLTLSLNAGAYMTEIVRGGIQSVDPGQTEAGRSLGLSYVTTMRRVVLPQAVKIMTPSFINQFVMTLKDTSLLAVIGFAELTYQGQQIYASNFRTGETLLIVAALYFIVINLLTMLSNKLDKRFNK
ncbi:amino acid ABC transporter substrate-binding protein/permease [Cryobacterium sp. PH29-G1]|uniref:amino acid ABC transporter substrate-binding protein/permease n=1 Tax=Cryobacterium sp. PH29-G1 TaxID=3046211 RepID=UPI0024BBDF11|nr:amino acid ABC transporter substrate-binding protein/permease [Cryobacterium sp. PH29-G1]MDJ0350458.1 amino acid ABC transporter substrate-binding protein/permease [Cryobacterium sp. PH29-G1]